MTPEQRDQGLNDLERRQTSDLLEAAESAVREGKEVAERLRLATQQYRDRLNPKKGAHR